jgi:hypothetical protein
MSDNKIPIINIFTYKLPKALSKPIYNEFQNRFKEAIRIIDGYPKYRILKEEVESVELLLALSIFYNRIIANLDSAIKFYGTVIQNSEADSIAIGSYNLNSSEIKRIQSLIILYQKLINKYGITEKLWSYSNTVDFLRNLINIKEKDDER